MRRFSFLMPGLVFTLHTASAQNPPDLGSLAIFPADNYWHWDISKLQTHPNSDAIVKWVGNGASLHPDFGTVYEGQPWGIPYVVADRNQTPVKIVYTEYGDESDPGPYPIALTAPVEGGPASDGDRHVLAVDRDNKVLYELYRAFPRTGQWEAASGAKFNLTSNALRPETWTSADAAGLPIFPGLVRYEEVARGEINHAIRMTVDISQRKYIWPARHQAGSSNDPSAPPMGMRFRLKASYNIDKFPPTAKVILTALKKYGMIVADNGGNWFISGAPDTRWNDDEIDGLKALKGSDFEAVLSVDADGKPIYPPGMGVLRPVTAGRSGREGPVLDLLGRAVPWKPWGDAAPVIRGARLSLPY